MSIIIQAGHESSSSEALMEWLYSRGFKKPILSNVQQLSGKKIADTLDKIISRKQSADNSKLTESIVVDFLLANIDQNDWGWADSKNLTALSYWQSFEPNTRFVLVFDHPKKMLSQFAEDELTRSKVSDLMEEWVLYHSTLLSFFEAHSDTCLLLEGLFATKKVIETRNLFQSLSSSLVLNSHSQVDTNSIKDIRIIEKNNNIAHEMMVEEIVKNYPEVVNVFNSLLNKANLKGSKVIYKTKKPEIDTLVAAITDITNLKTDLDHKSHTIDHLQKECKAADVLKSENERLTAALFRAQEAINKLSKEKTAIEKKVTDFEQVDKKNEELALENNALIAALHTLQESIERKTTDNQSVEMNDKKLLMTNQILEQENAWLVDELHDTQNLLEKKYASLKPSNIDEMVQSNKNIQASGTVSIYHTPESRVKNDFPYRLGATLVKTKTMKDMLSLPMTVAREYHDYLQIKKELESLPPLDKESDVLQAEKTKAHLSYRVGNAITQSIKSPKRIINMPVILGKEILNFKK